MRFFVVCFSVFALLCGCQKKGDTTVFAVVDGDPLTAEYVKGVVLVQAKIAELSGTKISPKDFPQWGNSQAMRLLPGLISARVVLHEIVRQGIETTTNDVRKAFENYAAATKRKVGTVDELAAAFGDVEPQFREQFENSVRLAAWQRLHPVPEVTADDLSTFFRQLTNQCEQARQVDAVARQKGQKAWERLHKGEDWSRVAAEYSEDLLIDEANGDFSNEWATVGLDGFGYPELAKAIVNMKAGDISKPLETDEGLMIVKVMDKVENNWTLGRIIFRLAQPVEFPSVEEARLQLEAERARESQVALQRQLYKNAQITFPLGTKFSYRIWPEIPSDSAHIE